MDQSFHHHRHHQAKKIKHKRKRIPKHLRERFIQSRPSMNLWRERTDFILMMSRLENFRPSDFFPSSSFIPMAQATTHVGMMLLYQRWLVDPTKNLQYYDSMPELCSG
jgi:hypothetical protein